MSSTCSAASWIWNPRKPRCWKKSAPARPFRRKLCVPPERLNCRLSRNAKPSRTPRRIFLMVENNEAQLERVEIAVAPPRRFGRGAKFSCRKKASGCRLHATRRNDGRCVGKRCDLQQAPVTTFEQRCNVLIFRPSHGTESFIRRRARNHLLSRFSPGEYRGAEAANAVIQHQFKFYESLLQPMIPQLASRSAAEFLLFQYDEAWRLIHGKGILDLHERKKWETVEPIFKRAIKYLVELICLNEFNSPAKPTFDEALFAMESALVCAECMVDLAQQSDSAHLVFRNDCVVRIF